MNNDPRGGNRPWVMSHLTVADLEKSILFYQHAFALTLKEDPKRDDNDAVVHAEMVYQDQLIMFGQEGAFGATVKSPINSGVEAAVNLYVYVDDVDRFCAHAEKNGARVLSKPEDMFWGDRVCMLQDPDHYMWMFATVNGAG